MYSGGSRPLLGAESDVALNFLQGFIVFKTE